MTKVEAPDREALLRAFRRAVAESRDHSAVVEAYVDGREFSVELLVWDRTPRVIAITDKCTTGAPYFVETGHSQPALVSEAERKLIEGAAIRGTVALGIDWAAAHAEVRLTRDGPYLMEIGARLGGGLHYH